MVNVIGQIRTKTGYETVKVKQAASTQAHPLEPMSLF